MGGMGKTSLAAEAATWWTRSGRFADGACFVSFEQFVSADRVVQVLGAYIEGPSFDSKPASDQRRRVIDHFKTKDVLMVWDNFESTLKQFQDEAEGIASPYTDDERHRLSELFHDLTSAGRGCILVTCRPGETGLRGAHRFELHGLARPDSLWLLSNILRRDGVSLEDKGLTRENLGPLLDDLADHPLSMELVGPHLKSLSPEQIRADFGKLLQELKQEAPEERNTSLRASLEFSRRHLSPAAQTTLPWLSLFHGGVFEDNFLDVSQIQPEEWTPIRQELEAIALIRAEEVILVAGRPFLRFHPTLAAACDRSLAGDPEIRRRIVSVYWALMRALDQALRGSQSRTALQILSLEEANYRAAVRWAIHDGQLAVAAGLGDTFSRYLQMSGRLRERDAWVSMLREAVGADGFTQHAAQYEREQAWTRFVQGEPQGAVRQLEMLIARLEGPCDFDPAFELGNSLLTLGRVQHNSGESTRAIPIFQRAIIQWEALVEASEGKPWRSCLEDEHEVTDSAGFGNLSAGMGDLANALRNAGKYQEALQVAEEALTIQLKLGNLREVAADHGRSARILMALGRLDEADRRYDSALSAVREAGDRELEGITLHHQGSLAVERGQWSQATDLYRRALALYQSSNNLGNMMLACNSLGNVERRMGRLAEARGWYEMSRDLARRLNDLPGLGQAAQNIGIVCQDEGDAARQRGDENAAVTHYRTARESVEESLRIDASLENRVGEADSLGQLAKIHLRLGDLKDAEVCATQSLAICEPLGLTDAWKDYDTLSKIAVARSDEAAAREWAQKRDAMLAEKKRRAGGGGSLSAEAVQAMAGLTVACAMAGFGGEPLRPEAQESLATIEGWPAPLPDFAAALRRLAAGQVPDVPQALPAQLKDIFTDIIAQIRQAQT